MRLRRDWRSELRRRDRAPLLLLQRPVDVLAMTSYQRAKRIYMLRGSAIVLLGATFVMLASAYVGQLTQ